MKVLGPFGHHCRPECVKLGPPRAQMKFHEIESAVHLESVVCIKHYHSSDDLKVLEGLKSSGRPGASTLPHFDVKAPS